MTTTSKTEFEANRKERLVFYTNAKLKKRIVHEAAKKNVSVSTLLQSELLGKFSQENERLK